MATPSEQGILLEDCIHAALSWLPNTECMREQDIRAKFNDQSINGVDHWICKESIHVLIQDKWKDSSTTQQEVSQFLSCVERIQARCDQTATFYLIWAGKTQPTSHSMKALTERNVTIITCSYSLEALARIVVEDVCGIFGYDPYEFSKYVPYVKRNLVSTTPSRREVHVQPPQPVQAPQQTVAYDDTEQGKASRVRIEALISQIQNNSIRKIQNTQSNSTISDVWQLFTAAFPNDISKWTDGSFKKIDYNAFMRTIKGVSYPTKQKHFRSNCFFFYIKLRNISIELAGFASQYNTLREQMLAEKSVWARKLPQIKCTAEPMTDTEYRAQVVHCEDYWMNTYGPGGTIVKKPSGLEYQFYQQYMVY
jgi:hypothetical protein